MHFSIVADYFKRIDATSSRLDITYLLAELLAQATAQEAEIICTLSLGQLHPPYIGTQFNIATKNMIRVVAALQNQTEDHIKDALKELGDLGSVAECGGWTVDDTLSVTDVYNRLDYIEKLHGSGSAEDKNRYLVELLAQCDPLSAKYIVRIVLGKLRLGFSDMTLIDALSWMKAGDKSLKRST